MKCHWLSLLLVLVLVRPALADLSWPSVFRDRDRCVFIGDSITHAGEWMRFVEVYHLTRFPAVRFDFRNRGIGGDTASGVLRRWESDITPTRPTVAIVMLGMNDAWWQRNQLTTPGTYGTEMRRIVDRLQEIGARVLLMTPSIYDEETRTGPQPETWREPILQQYVADLRNLSAVRGVPLLDIHTPMDAAMRINRERQPNFSFTASDRVHPKQTGYLEMARLFLGFQQASGTVSQLTIDLAKKMVLPESNCQVTDPIWSEDSFAAVILEPALPLPLEQIDKDALEDVPWRKEFNQEQFCAAGLKAGDYRLTIDGIHIATLSANEWAAGLNLADLSQTPQRRQAEALDRLHLKRFRIEADQLRWALMLEHGELKQTVAAGDVGAADAAVAHYLQAISDPEQRAEQRKKYERYRQIKMNQAQLEEQIDNLSQRIESLRKPKPHRYELKRVNLAGN